MSEEKFKEKDSVYYVDCNSCSVKEGYFCGKLKNDSYQLKCYYPWNERNLAMDRVYYITTKHIFKDYKEAVLSISDVLREHREEQEQKRKENLKPKCGNCRCYHKNKCFAFPDKELKTKDNRIGCMYFKVVEY